MTKDFGKFEGNNAMNHNRNLHYAPWYFVFCCNRFIFAFGRKLKIYQPCWQRDWEQQATCNILHFCYSQKTKTSCINIFIHRCQAVRRSKSLQHHFSVGLEWMTTFFHTSDIICFDFLKKHLLNIAQVISLSSFHAQYCISHPTKCRIFFFMLIIGAFID